MRRSLLLTLCAISLATGCATQVSGRRFHPASAVRGSGSVTIESVRYLPAERGELQPNQFHWRKVGTISFEIPFADHLRRCLVQELEASGYVVGRGGAGLVVEIERYEIADRFTSLEMIVESKWTLSSGGRSITRPLRASRRHRLYTSARKAEDMNNMATEMYESFFSDPEVRSLLAAGS